LNQLEVEIHRSGVRQERFIFTGDRPDVENYYAITDVALVTSVTRSEGIPTTLVEAMSCGLPMVVTDVRAVREAVEDGVIGFVVPPLDPARLPVPLFASSGAPISVSVWAKRGDVAPWSAMMSKSVRTHVRAFEAAITHHRVRNGTRLVKGFLRMGCRLQQKGCFYQSMATEM
jgi:hypothetical protein